MKCNSYLCVWFLHFVCLLILLTLTKDTVEAHELKRPAPEFSRHKLIQPVVRHGRTRREISTTKHKSGAHHPEVTVTIDVDGEPHVLDLRLNEDLVTDNHVIRYQKNGKMVDHKPKAEEIDLCQYSGTISGKPGSWVALSTCHGVNGVIYDGQTMRYIQPAQGNDVQSKHYLYDHSHLNTDFHCGYEGGVTNDTKYDPLLLREHLEEKELKRNRGSRHKRSSDVNQVRGPYNANKLSRYVEMVLVTDHGEYLANGEDMRTVHHQMKDVANIINAVYAPLNIFIALVGVVVWNERDEIDLEEDGDRTLSKFLTYRKQLLPSMPNDNAQLLTRQKFKDGVVGKGLKGPICTYEFSGAVSTNHSEVIGLVAATIAHEMGHNFGMEHDTAEDCECPDEKCIMSPSSTSVVPTRWSSCSLMSLALAFEKGMDYCLRNKPRRLAESPTCGNGFVEAGEQCDCGTMVAPGARNACHSCCHPDTCQLRSNATCATGLCCDLQTCRPKSAGTVCRSADRECDLPEYCSGYSEFCPDDVYKMDTTPCSNNEAYCVRGTCRTRDEQCRLLWGTTGHNSNERCYTQNNVKGNINGNCGYDRVHLEFKVCAMQDVQCGLLQCRHLNERLEFGMESVAALSQIFINSHGTIIPCRTAIIDLGLSDTDPGMVPDGASCGDGMMCLNHACVDVERVRETIMMKDSSVCPSNCSGNGICNSEGHCHCWAGYAPPLCAMPGVGGSLDSGPATDPSVQRNFMIAMYIIFLGIIPSIILTFFFIYYWRHNVMFWWKKPKKTMPTPKKASLPSRLSRSATKFASNFQNNTQNPQPIVNTLSNPDDMSSSLLRSDSERSPSGNINPSVNFFGNFKGFSLVPIQKNSSNKVSENTNEITNPTTNIPADVKPVLKNVVENVPNKSAKITPVHRSGSNVQSLVNQGNGKSLLRSAPPLPVVPDIAKTSPNSSPSVKRSNSTVQNKIKALMSHEKTEELHPVVSNPPIRPVISSPILEASTCTAKELISPLQGSKTLGPVRAAPTIPPSLSDFSKRPLSMHSAGNVPQKPLPEEPKKVKEGISLNRIASFLKQDKDKPKEKERKPVERSHSLPKNPVHQLKVAKDKVPLRNLQISNPILQKDIELSVNTVPVVSDSEDNDDSKSFVNRAQSMRAPLAQKPSIQSFGSMRQASGVTRPLSIVGRPTAPPPPLPNPSTEKTNQTSLYQHPKPKAEIKPTDYVDCIEEKPAPLSHIDEDNGENIYTIIEESPIKHAKNLPGVPPPIKTTPQPPPDGYNTPKPMPANSGSSESMGLLGEIVNEIQNRNFDSIYSTSTLARKKKEKEKQEQEANRDSTYINADHYKTPESVYSNSGAKSNVSTTSSGYLHPSAVNVPTYLKKDVQDKKEETTAPSSPKPAKDNSKIPTFSRQVTPPGLRSMTSFKHIPQTPKSNNKNVTKPLVNSPDVVSSCAVTESKNTKPPDVINNNKPSEAPKLATKPNITPKPNDNRPQLRPAPTVDKKPIVKTTPSLKPVNLSSNSNKNQDKPTVNRTNSKVESNIKVIADNLNKNKPKSLPKPTGLQKTESIVKPTTKLAAKPSNVASLQQKFENRKSLGKEIATTKK